ncbi:Zn-dependent hydrolase [Candidatus Saccharibacteria bacterium]|nr:MAG: Zn-dependent hydrolase [Candidatus Saccharibacteria bacterium]
MELQFYGANCVRISTKKAGIVVDDNLAALGAKAILKAGEVALYTTAHGAPLAEPKLVVDQPGEYEVSDISITGIAARAHMDEAGAHTATMYRIVGEDVRIGIVGHVHPDLSNDQLEQLGRLDVLIVPVGGYGYTLDAIGALKVIKAIEPKMVIPTHYDLAGLSYEVPQQTLENAVKELGMEPQPAVAKLRLKPGDFSEVTQLQILERA